MGAPQETMIGMLNTLEGVIILSAWAFAALFATAIVYTLVQKYRRK